MRLRSMPSRRWKIFEKRPTVSNGIGEDEYRVGNNEDNSPEMSISKKKEEKNII